MAARRTNSGASRSGRVLLAALLLGCAPVPAASPSPAPRLVALAHHPGDGPDAPERATLAWVDARGGMVVVDRPAIGWVARWRDGAALVDPSGRLYEVRPDGQRRMLARDAQGPLSTDGERLAYTTERGFLTTLNVHDGAQPHVWASGLAGATALRLEEDRLVFVGGPPGAVAGLWEARAEGPLRCLSNCGLRTGRPLGASFLAPPGRPEAIRLEPSAVVWRDASGALHRVPR